MHAPKAGSTGTLLALAAACAGGGLTPAFAQQESEAADILDEVIVTARREMEDLQEVPIAITAVTNDDIRQLDIRSVTDLQHVVPSLVSSGRLGQNEQSLTLRGQRATGEFLGAGAGPAVVSYLAEVPAATTGPGLYLDLANVQILKGPQGTLFGRNTTGGALLYEPRRPHDELAGYLQATAGDLGRFDLEGVANLPVVEDTLMLRLAVQQQRRDGLAVDVNTGTQFNNRDNRTLRLGIQFDPASWLGNYTLIQSVRFDENGPATILFEANPAGPLHALLEPLFAAQRQRGIRKVALGVHGPETRDTRVLLNRTELRLGDSTVLTNIASYTREEGNRSGDLDGTTLAIVDSLGITGFGDGANPNHSILTEELQLSGSAFDGRLEWRLGGFIERLRSEGRQTFSQRLSLGVTTHQLDAPQAVDSEAVFGHAKFDLAGLSDALAGVNLTAGYRDTRDASSIGFDLLIYPGQLLELAQIPPPQAGDLCFTGATHPNCLVEVDSADRGRSWNIGLDRRLGDTALLYGSYRRGYKSGGFNPAVGVFFGTEVAEFAFGPEHVDAVELGLKAHWSAGGTVGRTNLAIYHSGYHDVQVLNNVIIGVAATTATQNAAEATITGLEVEGEVRLSPPLALTYGYAFTDASYDTYVTPAGEDLSGLPFLHTPEHMLNIGLTLELALPPGTGTMTLFGSISWQDEMFAGFTTVDVPGVTVPAYRLVNLRLSWQQALGSGADVELFASNVADEDYRIANNALYESLGYALTQYGEPRLWGVSVRYSF